MKLMEERARVPLFLTYRAVGSGTGQKEFVGDSNNGVSWLVLAAVWWRGGCGGATPGTFVTFKIPSTVRTVLWVWLSSSAAFVRSFRLASCSGTRATATLVLETFPCPNPITTP